MSVVSCKLQAAGAAGEINSSLQRTYVHNFLVATNDDSDDQVVVLQQTLTATPNAIPQMYTDYNVLDGSDNGAFLTNKAVKRVQDDEGDRRHWLVTCTWGPLPGGTSSQEPPSENPLLEPIRYSIEWLPNQKGIAYEIVDDNAPAGNLQHPIVNSAGDFFEGVVVDDPYLVVVVVKNFAGNNLAAIITNAVSYQNTINKDTFWGQPPRKWKVESIQCSALQELNGISYYQVTYRVAFNRDTWDLVLVDRGTQCFDKDKDLPGAQKIPVRVLEGANKGDLLDMANLFPDGQQVPPNFIFPGFFVEPAFRIYRESMFSTIGLGTIPGLP